MKNSVFKILLSLLVMAVVTIVWLTKITIPGHLEQLDRIQAKADSIEALPPEIEYRPGEPVPYIVRDTVEVEKAGEAPELVTVSSDSAKLYRSAYNDGFIKGTIYASILKEEPVELKFSYRLIKPIESYIVTDTLIQKSYYPKIINTSTPYKREYTFLAGISTGGSAETFGMAAELELFTRQRLAYNYRYDFIRKEHWLGVKYPLFSKQ